ncbi:MAG: DUF1653 domain-containing protein [Clostridia bacterium]|nr:DUF1653 domain-containing protein [Clostridia bacterium]
MEYEVKPGKYRHYKGNEYRVIGMARHSETLEPMVVYQALYGEKGIWVRPAHMWSELVTVGDTQVLRFAPVEDAE